MPKTILVAGGGFSGTVAVLNLLQLALEARDQAFHGMSIHWLDKDNSFVRGLPYREQMDATERAFLLNIPAHMMSPFSHESDRYIEWLQVNAPEYNEYSFTPRAMYGRFLESVLAELESEVKRRNLGIKIIRRWADVVEVERKDGSLAVRYAGSPRVISCDAIALCVGHERLDQFTHLAEYPGYIRNPYDITEYVSAVEAANEDSVALIIGGGSSSIDAVRAFETLGFRGRYQIVSSSPVPPWPYDAELYKRRPTDNYKPAYLTAEAAAACNSFEQLMSLLDQEVQHALSNGFGHGSVYFGIKPNKLFGNVDSSAEHRSDFLHHFFQCRKAISAPESVRLLERLTESGRLVRVHGKAVCEGTAHRMGRFEIHVRGRSAQIVHGDVLVNCAQVLRAYQQPLNNRLLQRLCSNDLLRVSSSGLLEHVPDSGVYPLGPMASPPEGGPRYLWSARFFRDEIRTGINNLLFAPAAAAKIQNVAILPANTNVSQAAH